MTQTIYELLLAVLLASIFMFLVPGILYVCAIAITRGILRGRQLFEQDQKEKETHVAGRT
jgi:hypothetical protein